MNKQARSKTPLKPKAPFKWVFMGIIQVTPPKLLTSETNFSNYLLIVDAYKKKPKLYGMEIMTTKKVMDKLDIFKDIYRKVYEFGWWYLKRISADAGTQFTYTELQDKCQTSSVGLTFASTEHHEMNRQVKVTRRTLCTIAH